MMNATDEQVEFALDVGMVTILLSSAVSQDPGIVEAGEGSSDSTIEYASVAGVLFDLITTVMYHPEWAVAMCLKAGYPIDREDSTLWLKMFPMNTTNKKNTSC